eukprot:TRINITY_DN3077_c0_g1_i1.p1 TRINITY_DN3077_c0_g1~~TRINITY_DN3077_c0_g1_i1.p1  ORF type:complete len:313 (+),score=50.19 TRINITY_DN3077_c0_g1_i1:381-1319(+)
MVSRNCCPECRTLYVEHMRSSTVEYLTLAVLFAMFTAPPDWQGHGTDGIGNMEFKELLKNAPKPQKEHAALALLRMVEEAPDQTYSIVAIGPLTNVALAIKMSPDPTVFSRKLVDLVWMGGTHSATGNSTATAEFNAWADPEAAKVVFDSLPSKITMVGWEATVAHDLPWKWFDEHVKPSAEAEAPSETASSRTPIDRVLSTREFLWLATTHYERTCRVPGSPFEFLVCDALAMAVWLQPSLTKKVANLYCTVELAGKYTRGMVVLDHYGVLKRTAKADDMTAEGKERRFVKVVYTFDHDMYERLLIEAIGN